MNKFRIIQKACIRFILFVKYNEHCAPLSNHLRIILFDDVQYVRSLILIHKVYYSNTCNTVQNMFVRLCSVQAHCTRLLTFNFYLNHAVDNSSKSFITFHGIVLWNNLMNGLKELHLLPLFKFRLIDTIFQKY